MKKCPGVDISTGSLGQGLSTAVGMALRGKRDEMDYRVFALIGDGESQEGQIWEAVETASKYELDNLIIFVDHNGLQNDGPCEIIMPTRKLDEKFRSFGCETYVIDGHNMDQVLNTLVQIRNNRTGKPNCVIAHTVKGKGVSFMENIVAWHGMAPTDEEYERALKDIEEGF
jgi:transketolase